MSNVCHVGSWNCPKFMQNFKYTQIPVVEHKRNMSPQTVEELAQFKTPDHPFPRISAAWSHQVMSKVAPNIPRYSNLFPNIFKTAIMLEEKQDLCY